MKLGLLITVRLKSTRLPYKALLEIDGRTVLERVIERAKRVRNVDTVVVCTSTNPQDQPISDVALENDVHCFQGSEADVLDRLLTGAKYHRLDGFVSITADNPLFSIHYANRLADIAQRENPDFAEVTDAPIGTYPYYVRTAAAEVAYEAKQINDTEFWPVIFESSDAFDVSTYQADVPEADEWRLTLDTPTDHELQRKLHSEIQYDSVLGTFEVYDYLRTHPDTAQINADYEATTIDDSLESMVESTFGEADESIRKLKNRIYQQSNDKSN